MRAAMIGAVALMLAGCAHLPGHKAVPRGGETITFERRSTGFCLSCSNYVITLGPDGQGIFSGGRNAAVIGDHRFRANSDAVRAFAQRLAPYRPEHETLITPGEISCALPSTDQDTLDIRWHSADGTSAHLVLYEGCRTLRKPMMAEALRSAPSLLPIADLIGPH